MINRRLFVTITLLFTLGACMGSGDDQPAKVEAVPAAVSGTAVSATVIDQRPYVVNGEESSKLIGSRRNSMGKIVDLKTESGDPVAEEATNLLVRALEWRGVTAAPLVLPTGATDDVVQAAFQAHGTNRLLVVQMREWKIDTLNKISARWYLDAIVYDRSGNVLGQRANRGYEPVGTIGLEEKSSNAELANAEMSNRLTLLLAEPEISRALSGQN